jgi:hypothetical protein
VTAALALIYFNRNADFQMTKHVSPEITGAELIGTDYIRADDDAIMVEALPGYFVRKVGTSAPKIIKPPHAKPRD